MLTNLKFTIDRFIYFDEQCWMNDIGTTGTFMVFVAPIRTLSYVDKVPRGNHHLGKTLRFVLVISSSLLYILELVPKFRYLIKSVH